MKNLHGGTRWGGVDESIPKITKEHTKKVSRPLSKKEL